MEFLKEILGEDLFKQLESRLNEHNGKEENKEKQIKLGNLGGGEYVSKAKYDSELEKLNGLLTGKDTELSTANNLIETLKKSTKGNEDLQGKISTYEKTVTELQKQLAETKIKAAVKVALLSEKVDDIDYMTYKVNEKLKEQGKTLELDENENIKGWEDLISDMKTQLPSHFESANGSGKKVEEKKLPTGDDRQPEPTNLADALKMQYENN